MQMLPSFRARTAVPFVAICVASLVECAFTQSIWEEALAAPTGGAPRANATGLLRADGAIVLFGGSPWDASGDSNGTVQSLAVGATAWVIEPRLEGPFERLCSATIGDDRILVFGGVIPDDGDEGGVYAYDFVEGLQGGAPERSDAAPFDFVACTTDATGRVYSIGGGPGLAASVDDPNSAHVERFVPDANEWEVLAPLPSPRADATSCSDGSGHVLVFGGIDALANERLASVARFDVDGGTWSEGSIPPMPLALSGAQAVLGADERIYLIGGVSGSIGAGTVEARVHVLDLTAGTWSEAASLATPRQRFAAVLGTDDCIHVIGGTPFGSDPGTASHERLFTPACPTFVQQPGTTSAWRGDSIVLDAAVAGATPMTMRWSRDGKELQDGTTPHGSTISGADSNELVIVDAGVGDGGAYTLAISNACGATVSDESVVEVREPPSLAGAWTVRVLDPAWSAASTMNGVSASSAGGSATIEVPPYGAQGQAVIWADDGTTVEVTPPDSVGAVILSSGVGGHAGWWWWPYQCHVGGQWQTCYTKQAAWWSDDGSVFRNLQISGIEYSVAADIEADSIGGYGWYDDASGNVYSRAFLWRLPDFTRTALHPADVRNSSVSAIDGERQFGSITTPFPFATHAAGWSGSAASFVDMHPSGASRSWVTGAGDGQQVGSAYFGDVQQPTLWTGRASSARSLLPSSATSASLNDADGGVQVGAASLPGGSHATAWRGAGDDYVDLHPMLPVVYASSIARAVFVDDVTGAVRVVGSAYDPVAERSVAVSWHWPALEERAADLNGDGVVDGADLAVLLSAWGTAGAAADLDGSGEVDGADLAMLLADWG